jgi:hypothetical protein
MSGMAQGPDSEFDPERIIALRLSREGHDPGSETGGGAPSFTVTTSDFATLATLPKTPPLYSELTHHEVEIYSVGPSGQEVRRFLSSGSLLERLKHQLAKPGGMVEVDDVDGWHVYIPLHTITQVRIREVGARHL